MSFLLKTKRRIVQSAFLVLLNTNLGGWGTESLCLGVMNCEACAIAWLGCPVGMAARSIAYPEFPWLVLMCIVGLGVIIGRFLCGWVCPLGFLQDLLHKIPSFKFKLWHPLTWIKYAFLFVTVMAVPYLVGSETVSHHVDDVVIEDNAGMDAGDDMAGDDMMMEMGEAKYTLSPLFFCNLCPTAALQVVIPSMIIEQDFSMDRGRIIRFSLLALFFIFALGNHRSFCKVVCPIGAMVAVTNKFSFFKVRLDDSNCNNCKACERACPMEIEISEYMKEEKPVSRNLECIECLNCEQACPKGAIKNNSHILK